MREIEYNPYLNYGKILVVLKSRDWDSLKVFFFIYFFVKWEYFLYVIGCIWLVECKVRFDNKYDFGRCYYMLKVIRVVSIVFHNSEKNKS